MLRLEWVKNILGIKWV